MTSLPYGWLEAPLQDLAKLGSGGTPQAKNPAFYEGGEIPWAIIGDLNDGVVNSTGQKITPAGLDKSSAKVVPADTIMLGMYGSIGKLGISGIPMATNQAIATIQPSERIDVRYLFYYLLSQRRDLDHEGKGAAQRNISQTILKPWPIRFPTDVDAQRRIVDLLEEHLSRLDAAATYARIAGKRVDSLRASALSSAFEGDPIKLGELAVKSGYGTSEKCVVGGPGPAVVRIPNLTAGIVDLSDEKRVASPTADVTSSMLEPGDVLIVRTNGSVDLIGRSAVVQLGVDAAFASYLIRYRVDPARIRPEWVHAMLSAPQSRRLLEQLAASSAGQHNLSLGKLDAVPIPLPALPEQDSRLRRLREMTEDMNRLAKATTAVSVRSTALRRSLLAAAFTGRLTGSDTDLSVAKEMISA